MVICNKIIRSAVASVSALITGLFVYAKPLLFYKMSRVIRLMTKGRFYDPPDSDGSIYGKEKAVKSNSKSVGYSGLMARRT